MKKISIDIPITELTLRKYEKPFNLQGRDLVRKLCLSIGLLQPGDSRDVIVDVFQVLLEAKKNNELLNSEQIQQRVIELRKQEKLKLQGIAPSNVRRQIKRMRQLYLVEKVRTNYRIAENDKLIKIFEDKIEQFLLKSTLERIKEYLQKVDE